MIRIKVYLHFVTLIDITGRGIISIIGVSVVICNISLEIFREWKDQSMFDKMTNMCGVQVRLWFCRRILSASSATHHEEEYQYNDTIINMTRLASTVGETYYMLIFEDMSREETTAIKRKGRCVSNIFSELGLYYALHTYWMSEEDFWRLYNSLQTCVPKKKERKRATRDYLKLFSTISTAKIDCIINLFCTCFTNFWALWMPYINWYATCLKVFVYILCSPLFLALLMIPLVKTISLH